MDILRRLGIQITVDTKGAGQGISKIDNSLNKLLKTAAGVGVALTGAFFVFQRAGRSLSEFASLGGSAVEALNLLEVVFEENAKGIQDWADTLSTAIGRSRFETRKQVASFGALAKSMVGTGDEARELAQDLTEMAFDLASVYDREDEEAFAALKSGLSGMSMPLKRFGIDLTETALAEFALSEGITESTAKMSQSEKVILRHRLLLKEWAKVAKGDAQRTADSFINSQKGMEAAWDDLTTELSLRFLPTFTRFTRSMRDGLRALDEFEKQTGLLEASVKLLTTGMIGLGVAATVAARKTLIGWLAALAPIALAAAGITALILLFEDIAGLLTGKTNTALEDFIKLLFGAERGGKLVQAIQKEFKEITAWINKAIEAISEFFGLIGEFTGLSEAFAGPAGPTPIAPTAAALLSPGGGLAAPAVIPLAPTAAGSTSSSQTVTNNFTINDASDPFMVQSAIERALDASFTSTKEEFDARKP